MVRDPIRPGFKGIKDVRMSRRPVKFGSGRHMSQSFPGHQNATSLTTYNKI